MFDKVLILSASAGAGHIRAAQAVERAFVEAQAAREVRHVDMLEYTNKLFRNLYSRAYIDMVNNAPEMLGWLYDHLDKPWKNERRRLAFDKLNTRPFVKMLKAYGAEMVVCTHFLPAEIISWLKAKERINTRQAIVVTDFDVHAMWLCHHYEQYFVALDETREHLTQLGIPPSKLTVSGIPIDPVFNIKKDRREMREKLNLAQDRTTILVSAGGFGVGPIDHLLTSLLQLKHPAQAIVVCGRNEELKARVERLTSTAEAREGHVDVHALGYTTLMDEYMAAADIVLGKPGGLTTSEALARGLAFVIVNPIPGQEERNSDHLLEEGVAIRCNNLPVLAYKIDRLLDDPARLETMKANALRLAHPRAAQEIVSKLLALRTS
ncbi:MAG: processive 1,2-diacylglycerol beta-glucosyltransferase [Blastocatellia bacterium]|jgi:processive 1,2-diacylglycerol beta-glucosyltransferase|nr:processive 1,2-diacylglycerol beta-glucosyltransferase [Blastocatellia bacterium]